MHGAAKAVTGNSAEAGETAVLLMDDRTFASQPVPSKCVGDQKGQSPLSCASPPLEHHAQVPLEQ